MLTAVWSFLSVAGFFLAVAVAHKGPTRFERVGHSAAYALTSGAAAGVVILINL